MISTSMSVIVVLVALVNGARNEDDIQPCAKIQTSSSVVPLGSPVTATCVIRDDCPLVIGRAVHIAWRLGDRFVPSSPAANESGRVSEVVIPNFNHTREFLTCCVRTSTYQVVEGVEIRAGYPPEAPQNLSCQTNLTTPNTLTCSWTPGQQETHLLTKYTLHTEIRDSNENHTYELLPGRHRYTIPRFGFVLFSDVEIYVKAVNELGEATSAPIILEPVSSAKFDRPTILKIQAVPKRYGCLKLSWSLSQHQVWMSNLQLNLEVRLTTADGSQRSGQPILVNRIRPSRSVDQCRLLHGTRYLAQIRVRYQQSPWSEWSSSQSGVTLESAPTGRLDSWMRVSGDHTNKQLNVLLFWKPSKQFRANGQNVSYIVSVKKLPGSFEPYKPYGIAVYPRFKDGMGLPQTVNAYSRQKVVNADLEERRVVLRDLNTGSLYEAFMMVSTFGGSLNGSTIHFKIDSFDTVAVVTIVPVSVVGLLLIIIFVAMTSFSNNKRLKGRFWPAVPDPANSSIRRWTSESTQGSHLSLDEEPNPMYLSHLSFLDLPVKLRKEDDDLWSSSAEDTSDLGESICGSPFTPGYSGSNSDAVPYATVIFSGPCSSPSPEDLQRVYLRSESTQPLLETEESISPKCYHNMGSVGMQREQCFFGPSHDCAPEKVADPGLLCDDFPFLRALSLKQTEID
ncbi:Granulocyte colony-stimulating factor receptor [Liparis tanakae]|uniref:Granulocyte colony-stimulating factor receptor n=1 Tax=Liparis tanakae TaxID=230148 RepID=A0A4Z2JG08_9TELE|nr:Granulocyte colony-stimulating factor receptor [Liparis tanakae]